MQIKRKTKNIRKNRGKCSEKGPCKDTNWLVGHQFFKALCDPVRVGLFVNLAQRCSPTKVSELAECCPVDLSVVSRHLAILKSAGILEAKKNGREVYYGVRYSELVEALRAMADGIEACCPKEDIVQKEGLK